MQTDTRSIKTILCLSLKLQTAFTIYKAGTLQEQKDIADKFRLVWGANIAAHFLSKYDSADSLIWALDSTNLDLFIKKF